MPYATTERHTRPLIAINRWPSRARRQLLAGDLASLLNAVICDQSTRAAAEADSKIRALKYSGTMPYTTEQTPALGGGNWGELLERLIENAPPISDFKSEPATNDLNVNCLPHLIEVSVNPLGVVLIWLGPSGVPKRHDFYAPTLRAPQPYGTAGWVVRKTLVAPEMIQLCGEILRDHLAPETADTPNETAAALAGAAAADNQDQSSIPGHNTPEHRHESEAPQAVEQPAW